ncbi:MAG: hypothetical protein L0226_00030 [Acidobacteria bacterium]|nr:hypothetical protein [Acidobacteriota bacterium]
MNCKDFENIVNDLAHGRIMDAVAQERGLAHAASCARCAARLANETALSAGLRVLAASDETRMAPSSAEAVLVRAFRQSVVTKSAISLPVRHQPARRWALAAAALMLIALGLIAYGTLQTTSSKPELVGPVTPNLSGPTPTPEERKQDLPHSPAINPKVTVVKMKPRPRGNRNNDNRIRKTPDTLVANPPTQQFLIRDEMTLYANGSAGDSEVTTDFLPLTYSPNLPQMESGQLIRVQMPRSALLKFGLPMNLERANVPVKADLLVGEDGLAQAIRFVR